MILPEDNENKKEIVEIIQSTHEGNVMYPD